MTRTRPFIFAQISPLEACTTAALGTSTAILSQPSASRGPLVERDGVGGRRPTRRTIDR